MPFRSAMRAGGQGLSHLLTPPEGEVKCSPGSAVRCRQCHAIPSAHFHCLTHVFQSKTQTVHIHMHIFYHVASSLREGAAAKAVKCPAILYPRALQYLSRCALWDNNLARSILVWKIGFLKKGHQHSSIQVLPITVSDTFPLEGCMLNEYRVYFWLV